MVTSGAESATECICCIACVDDEGVDRFLSTLTADCTRAAPAHAFNCRPEQVRLKAPARSCSLQLGAAGMRRRRRPPYYIHLDLVYTRIYISIIYINIAHAIDTAPFKS